MAVFLSAVYNDLMRRQLSSVLRRKSKNSSIYSSRDIHQMVMMDGRDTSAIAELYPEQSIVWTPAKCEGDERDTNEHDNFEEFRRLRRSTSRAEFSGSAEDSSDEIMGISDHAAINVRNIQNVTINGHVIRTWFFSPYPHPFHRMQHLYVCDYCMKYFASKWELQRHQTMSRERTPPGREIYRNDNISVFELSGNLQKPVCQCLCLLGKLFIDEKSVFYDVEKFLFYVVCECDDRGAHLAGFFSKKVNTDDNNILACIVVLPPYQSRGYGRLMISMAYAIAKRDNIVGRPEYPLSECAAKAFHSYWWETIIRALTENGNAVGINELVGLTWIAREDIIECLKRHGHIHLISDAPTLQITKSDIDDAFAKIMEKEKSEKMIFTPKMLIWLPENRPVSTG